MQIARDILRDTNGDFAVPFTILRDPLQAIAQSVGIRLQFIMGEWFLDVTAGLPYMQNLQQTGTPIMGTKSPNLGLIASMLRNEILNTPGISSITAFAIDFDDRSRTLSCQWSASTDFGQLTNQKTQVTR